MPNPVPWLESLRQGFSQILPWATIAYPADTVDPSSIEVAIVADPPRGALTKFNNLKVIASLWTGVDGILADPTYPGHTNKNITLVRLLDPEMSRSMSESALMHTLNAHRQLHAYARQQRAQVWEKRPNGLFQPMTHERHVGILGSGELGQASARILSQHGFTVTTWGRSPRPVAADKGFKYLHGPEGFDQILSDSEILINLLPLTNETRGLLNKDSFAKMRKGSTLINLARGAHVIEPDLIDALDQGHIDMAVLDVFAKEPLPADNPLWNHPRVVVTPHVAALTNPSTAGVVIAKTIHDHFNGNYPLRGTVDLTRGY
ncbi:hypothetical protein HDU76_007749 [Blyttiomyces sp. JEL0837]|nr:hypothetical protein HDU76_007749 [Blyttiomyces sp. JEL0837]